MRFFGIAPPKLADVVKTGRTHLMDAMPITLGQELSAWHSQIAAAESRLAEVTPRLLALAQGGTAVGTGINSRPEFGAVFARHLAQRTGHAFRPSDNFFAALSSQDTAVGRRAARFGVSLMKNRE